MNLIENLIIGEKMNILNKLKEKIIDQHNKLEKEWMRNNFYTKCNDCGELKLLKELNKIEHVNRNYLIFDNIIFKCKNREVCKKRSNNAQKK